MSMFGWLTSLFRPATRFPPGPDTADNGHPTDAEFEAVMAWMQANGVEGDDFGMTYFKAAPFLRPKATMIVIGEGNTQSPNPMGFFVELAGVEVLEAGQLHPSIFAQANDLAEKAYDEGLRLSELVVERSAEMAA